MLTVALTLLVASAGLFALGAIAGTLRRYGPAALRLRQALASCPQQRELRFTLTDVRCTQRSAAQILRPNFAFRAAPRRTATVPLRAAA